MDNTIDGDIHAGLSGLEFEEDSFDLGHGISLTKTYAHLMAPFLMAFKPAPPGGHHPAPWKATTGGFSVDVSADLLIPTDVEEQYGAKIDVARTIVFLIRLGVNPATTLSVLASHSFSALSQVEDQNAKLFPFEIEPRHFSLTVTDGMATADSMAWVKERWQVTRRLMADSSEFSMAVAAIDAGQFIHNSALALVSLWGALESLFSPSTSELKFRVSSLIAAYLESPGSARASLQSDIAKLYNKRSAAAHGKPKHNSEDLLNTFILLRRVLIAMIDQGEIPSKTHLEGLLFGSVTNSEIEA